MDQRADLTPADILDFWYSPAMRERWFDSTPEIDAEILARYEAIWDAASKGGLQGWESSPEGALALVLILDQFPLNMCRSRPGSFSTEAMSREVAMRAIEKGFDRDMSVDQRLFLYMPYMHSEDLADQDRAVELFEQGGLEVKWAIHHRDIVRRFGRFPHRNGILGRESTPEEVDWLASDEGFHG